MTPDVIPTPVDEVIAKLVKSHGEVLFPDESFVSVCRGGMVDAVEPGVVFGRLGPIGRRMERSLAVDEIEVRTNRVRLFLHRRGLQRFEFLDTKVGYTLALTYRRVIVFDFARRKVLSESPIRNMAIERLDHDDGLSTIFFCEGKQAVAVTLWEDREVVDHFVESYRGAQAAAFDRISPSHVGTERRRAAS